MALACALWWEVLAYRKRIGHLFRFVHRDVRSLRNGCTTPAAERKRNIFDYFAIYAGKDVTDRALGVLATVIPGEYRRNSRRKPGWLFWLSEKVLRPTAQVSWEVMYLFLSGESRLLAMHWKHALSSGKACLHHIESIRKTVGGQPCGAVIFKKNIKR